nr:unnamed protein product [Callosobruchus analis]
MIHPRHYAIFPSAPPPPAPIPCSKCLLFTHKTEQCTTPIKCLKCGEQHATAKCKTELPVKCNVCGSTDHQAWAFQCPKRPTKPLEGIPNLPVKTLNKTSRQIVNEEKKKSRIHEPLTVHDMIINTYVEELNHPGNTDREDILRKLRQKFIRHYNIETTVSLLEITGCIF